MDVPEEIQEVCSGLEHFRVPAVVIDGIDDRLVTWNTSFARVVGRPVEHLGTLRASEVLVGNPALVDPGTPGSMLPASALDGEGQLLTGHVFWRNARYRLFLLDVSAHDAVTDEYMRGVLVGQEWTHDQLKQRFHDSVSQQVMAATFAVETLRGKLEGNAAANARDVDAIYGLLQSLFTEIQSALNSDLTGPPPANAPQALNRRLT